MGGAHQPAGSQEPWRDPAKGACGAVPAQGRQMAGPTVTRLLRPPEDLGSDRAVAHPGPPRPTQAPPKQRSTRPQAGRRPSGHQGQHSLYEVSISNQGVPLFQKELSLRSEAESESRPGVTRCAMEGRRGGGAEMPLSLVHSVLTSGPRSHRGCPG